MIDSSHDYQARFIHTLTSPLTAMRGAVDLLRHPRRSGDDALTCDLIDTLERNCIRLSGYIDVIMKHYTIHGQLIHIAVPIDAFDTEQGRSIEAPLTPAAITAPLQPLDSTPMDLPASAGVKAGDAPAESTVLLIGPRASSASAVIARLRQARVSVDPGAPRHRPNRWR